MARKWITRSKIISDLLLGKMQPKMRNYYLKQILRLGKKNPSGDDFYWGEYSSHYQGELAGEKNIFSLTINPGDYLFEDNELKQINSNILPISPNAHLLTESICLLKPNSVREVGVGGGDYLNNLFVMLPNINLEGVDISRDQLAFLAKRHPHLKDFTFEYDIVKDNHKLSKTQLSYTQAVIMHIGEKNDRHLSALSKLINSTTETVLLSENWHKHNFLDDIKFLFDKGIINWKNINFYIKPYLQNSEIKLMICSNKELPFDELKNYQQLKN
jgi:hypothetical protein